MDEILIYEDPNAENPVQVRLEGQTVWLTQKQMAELFDKNVRTVSEHIRNLFREDELSESEVIRNFRITAADGKSYDTTHYNLDVIISVGYRVKSLRGTRFRQWATSVLRQHIVDGQTLNQARLAERGLVEARQALELLARTLETNALVDDTGRAVLALITGYAKTWRLLLQYDEDALILPEGCRPARGVLDYDKAQAAIAQIKADLQARGEATPLFGAERGEALAGILGSIEQTMFSEPLYKSREERAAHLLYFVIKDHPFSDGNKRIGSFLFLLYLQQEGMALRIDGTALTALALLVAESAPASKDLLIRLIVNLLTAD
jgi:prophage maintenance system killer protein